MELTLKLTTSAARHRWWRWPLLLLAVVGVAWAAAVVALWWGQEKLLFRPVVLRPDFAFKLPPDVQETWVDVPGARLNALHLKLPRPDGVVFYLHGNGGSLNSWFVNTEFYRALSLDLFMIDYRGYGKSSSRIESEAQLLADARTAWQQIAPRYQGQRRVFLGRSLGTGLAAQLAGEFQPELTLLVSPYHSMVQLAAEHYAFVPGAVLRYPLRTDLALPRIRGPVLLVHGGLDTLIPPSHSQRLQGLAARAAVLLVPGAGHGDIHQFEAYTAGVGAALAHPDRVAAK